MGEKIKLTFRIFVSILSYKVAGHPNPSQQTTLHIKVIAHHFKTHSLFSRNPFTRFMKRNISQTSDVQRY